MRVDCPLCGAKSAAARSFWAGSWSPYACRECGARSSPDELKPAMFARFVASRALWSVVSMFVAAAAYAVISGDAFPWRWFFTIVAGTVLVSVLLDLGIATWLRIGRRRTSGH